MQSPRPDQPRFREYEIIRELARGTSSVVYEARPTHPRLRERPVALKVLRQGCDSRHFLHVARVNASLSHARIPSLYHVAEESGRCYMASMFVEGENLQAGSGEATRSVGEVVRIIGDVAGALDYAHRLGFVHGSVHPRHVLLRRDGSAWLIGFGEYPPTEDTPFGNPRYLAPEQFMGQGKATVASDVYALAETAIWLLYRDHPFAGLQIRELMAAKRIGQIRPDIWEMRPDISAAMQQVLRRGLEPEPSRRYATASEFAVALSSAAPNKQ